MILSRTFLNPQRQGARKLLASPQAMHAAVLAGYPPTVDHGRPLWRLDVTGRQHPVLWVVSSVAPDMTHLEEQAGWPHKSTTESTTYDGFLSTLAPGQHWAFRLTANPTHRGTVNGAKKVLAHVTAEQQSQWLLSRQETIGVRWLSATGERTFTVVERGTKSFRRQAATVTLGTATFAGTLEVVDPARLKTALTAGIGRGKAYGCGLMTLARA